MVTTKHSKNSVAKTKQKALNRPFKKSILKRAEAVATQYQIIIGFDDEEGEYYGRGLELPLAMGNGKTIEACMKSTRKAIVAVLATLLENNQPIPSPASEGARTEQINFRVSIEEKLLLEQLASRGGFKGIGDFVRASILNG